MKKNIFEIGAKIKDGWQADNKTIKTQSQKKENKPPHEHCLYLLKERRRGKIVTIIKPFIHDKQTSQKLLKMIKKRLGCGGTFKVESLELQGDIAEQACRYLQEQGYKFR